MGGLCIVSSTVVELSQVGWKSVIERSFGHKTRYLLVMENESVVGLLPLAILKVGCLVGRSMLFSPFLN